jgi:WD40 repeat protein
MSMRPIIHYVMKILFSVFTLLLLVQLTSAQEFAGHTNDITEVKFNADATRLISYSAGDGWLCLWDVRSGRLLWRSKTEFIQKADEYYTLTSFAFSPDENLIASGSGNGTVQLWNAKTGEFLWRAEAHQDNVNVVEFSPDGKTIVSAATPDEGSDEIKVLRVEDGQVLKKLEGKSCVVIAMSFDDRHLLRTGNLDGSVSQWDLETGKQIDSASSLACRQRNIYQGETSFAPDLRISARRTGNMELTLTDTKSNTVKKKIEVDAYRVYARLSADSNKLVVNRYGGFTFYDLGTGETREIDEFSGTGSTIDLSRDGSLFAEGGSYGNAAIAITETKTGKSWLLGSRLNKQRVSPYRPSELQNRLIREKEQRQAVLRELKARRDKQAAIDAESLRKQVYISFDHYGDMTDPGQQRMIESDEPNKSKVKKSVADATAIWLRLHNDSPLPITIPTQSMYLPNAKCFFEFPNGKKILGLCDGREISIWHGLENRRGKQVPYGFDFGSSAILLPKTSVFFAVPRDVLRNGNAIRFGFTFLKQNDAKKVEEYGKAIVLRFRESDLPTGR